MSLTVEINSITIPDADIIKYPQNQESLAFEGNKIIPEQIELILDNSDRTKYDDRYTGSLFFGSSFYGFTVTVYDNDVNRYIFDGTMKDLKVNEGNDEIAVVATNYLDGLSSRTCIISGTSNTTPAEYVYTILTGSANGNIDTDLIVYAGFQNAINIQTANNAYIDIEFTSNKKKNCTSVLNELLRISACHLYTYQNLIYLYQWQPFNGQIGNQVYARNIIEKSYRHWYNQKNIFNSYRIAYDNAATIAYATDTDTSSITEFGERVFNVPEKELDKTATADFAINYKNITGATWAGDLIIDRYKNLKKMVEFSVGDELEFIPLADQMDMRNTPFIGEPVQVTGRNYDKNNNVIKVTGEFLNTPETYYVRDEEPPGAVELAEAFALPNGGVLLKWSKSQEADWLGYRIYFTTSKGAWFVEICNLGQSPVDNKNTSVTWDGYISQELHQLNAGVMYLFYVTAYDTSYNESDASNILSTVPLVATLENFYCLQGNIFEGLTLDINNALSGTVPTDKTTYADFDDASPDFSNVITGIYESGKQYAPDGFTSMTWSAIADPNDIKFSYRTSADGSTWSSYSTEIDAVSTSSVSLGDAVYFQYRFIYYSPLWADSDVTRILEIEEA